MRVLRYLSSLLFCLVLSAQIEPGQWVGDLYLVDLYSVSPFEKALIDENNHIKQVIPSVAKSVDFPINPRFLQYSNSFWYNGALYTTANGSTEKNEDGSVFRRWTFARWKEEDKEWRFLGEYKTSAREFLIAIPCANDRFIVISDIGDMARKNRLNHSPFVSASFPTGGSDRKELRIGSSIDYGIDELEKHITDLTVFGLPQLSAIAMTDEYAVLVSRKTGLYWIFSLETATLKKAGNIFSKVTPEMIVKGGFPGAILRVHPEKDGTVLVAAQEESFFTTETGDAIKEVNEFVQNNPDATRSDAEAFLARRQKELIDRNPFVVWYRIHPEGGRVEKLSMAPEGGKLLRESVQDDHWRPMPDGSVKMGIIEGKVMENHKKDSEKQSQGDPEKSKQAKASIGQ